MGKDGNLIGCFVCGPTVNWDDDQRIKAAAAEQGQLFRGYIWGDTGFDNCLKQLMHSDYGVDLKTILFQFYLNPIPVELAKLKAIGSYRKNEKSVAVTVIVDNDNFFKRTDEERRHFLKEAILNRAALLEGVAKKRKLDTDFKRLKIDLEKIFQANP